MAAASESSAPSVWLWTYFFYIAALPRGALVEEDENNMVELAQFVPQFFD